MVSASAFQAEDDSSILFTCSNKKKNSSDLRVTSIMFRENYLCNTLNSFSLFKICFCSLMVKHHPCNVDLTVRFCSEALIF